MDGWDGSDHASPTDLPNKMKGMLCRTAVAQRRQEQCKLTFFDEQFVTNKVGM